MPDGITGYMDIPEPEIQETRGPVDENYLYIDNNESNL